MAENEDDSILGTGVTTRQVEAFGRKVTATANHLIGETTSSAAYQQAMTNIHRGMRRPGLQRSVFSMTRASPRETLRAKLSTSEIQHRALSYIPDELLTNLPADEDSSYSLFQGFRATIPESDEEEDDDDAAVGETGRSRRKSRRSSRMQRLLKARGEEGDDGGGGGGGVGSQRLRRVKREQGRANHRLEMLGVRKNMASAEILEIDKKIANLHSMRKIVLDRLADLEDDELKLEQEIADIDIKVEDLQAIADEEEAASKAQAAAAATAAAAAGTAAISAASASGSQARSGVSEEEEEDGDTTPGAVTPATTEGGSGGDGFMSASIYGKLPDPNSSSKVRRQKLRKRKSMPIRHGHFEPGTSLMEIPAHNDIVTSLDFDAPFGTMVTAALDDTLRVWDLNSGRCLGLLEGHRASVRCVQVEDTMVATGSIDASIRLWDLSRIDAPPPPAPTEEEENEDDVTTPSTSEIYDPVPSAAATAECEVFSLEAHVAEITALHFRGDTLVSGSADKTLRQWDLVKGRCVQTLDVLWAAAQASATAPGGGGGNKASNLSSTSTNPSSSSSSSFPFSNNSTGGGGSGAGGGGHWRTTSRLPDANADFVGALQCFDAALACGTADGMVRLWDLRSGQVSRQLVGHTGPVTCLQFDDVHLVTGSLDRSIRVWDLRTGSIFDAFAYVNPVTSMMFDARRIVAAAGEGTVKVYDKADGRQWDCGGDANASVVERARVRDGFLVEGRRDGVVGVWSC